MKQFLIMLLMFSTLAFADTTKTTLSITFEEGNFFPITTSFNSQLLDDFTEKVLLYEGKILYLYFDSPGGNVMTLSRMIGIMKSSNIKFVCTARFAASAAFMLFEHCTERYLLSDGILMSHNWKGKFRDEAPRIKTLFDVINRIVTGIEETIVARLSIDMDEYKRLINNNLWMDTTLAIQYSAIDKIITNVGCTKELIRRRIKTTNSKQRFRRATYKSGCPLINKTYLHPEQVNYERY